MSAEKKPNADAGCARPPGLAGEPMKPPYEWYKSPAGWTLVAGTQENPQDQRIMLCAAGEMLLRDNDREELCGFDPAHPDAALIIRALNAHADLIDACVQARAALRTALDDVANPVGKQVINRRVETLTLALLKARPEPANNQLHHLEPGQNQ